MQRPSRPLQSSSQPLANDEPSKTDHSNYVSDSFETRREDEYEQDDEDDDDDDYTYDDDDNDDEDQEEEGEEEDEMMADEPMPDEPAMPDEVSKDGSSTIPPSGMPALSPQLDRQPFASK